MSDEQLTLIPPNEVTNKQALQSGNPQSFVRDLGYFPIWLEILDLGVTPNALTIYVHLSCVVHGGKFEGIDKIAPRAGMTAEEQDLAIAELIGKQVVTPDGDDLILNEPEQWEDVEA